MPNKGVKSVNVCQYDGWLCYIGLTKGFEAALYCGAQLTLRRESFAEVAAAAFLVNPTRSVLEDNLCYRDFGLTGFPRIV